MYIFLAVFSGFTVLLSIIALGAINKRIGLIQTNFINFATGMLGSIIIVIIANEFKLELLGEIPFYLYTIPFFVISITVLNSIVINKLSAVYTTILMFVGQLITGIIIDYFRFGVFSLGDFIGGIIILVGLFLNNKFDVEVKEEELT